MTAEVAAQTVMPNRHIMNVLTFVGLLPLVYFIPGWVMTYLTVDQWWSTVLAVGIIVPIHGYLGLPLLVGMYQRGIKILNPIPPVD